MSPNQTKDYSRIHAYDSLGRPSLTTQYLTDGAYTHATDYDAWGRVISETYQRGNDDAKIFQARYNAYGYLAQWQRAATTTPTAIPAIVLWRLTEQSAAQQPVVSRFGNNLTEIRDYDTRANRLRQLIVRNVALTNLVNDSYSFDAIGNVMTRNVVWDTGSFAENFTYDTLNRIKTSQVTGQALQSFEYDATGNMTRKTGVGGGTASTMVYPAQGPTAIRPHAITSVTGGTFGTGTYTYDANGNLATAPNGRTATWTSFDMPLTLTKGSNTATFTYGPEHQRTKQVRSGNTTVTYAGAMEVETNTSTNTRTIKTYWPMGIGVEIDRPATGSPAVTPPTQLNWLHKDRLGSPIAISGETGTLRERLAYDAWGKRRTTNGAATGTPATPTPDTIDGVVDNRGFTGHEMLDQLDLVHMNGRIYDPLIGRFLSADPILQDPMNGQSYNRYSYVMNNPTNLTDPTGFCANSTESRICASTFEKAEKTIASGTYVMNNVDGSRTAFVGGKVAMKTDGKGTVLFDAKAPQAASTAVPPQASNDITSVPRSAPISFGFQGKIQEKIDKFVEGDQSSVPRRAVGAAATAVNRVIVADDPLDVAIIVAGPVAKVMSKAAQGAEKLYHYAPSKYADSIAENGLRPGSSGKVFTTPNGSMSPLQAQIDLALPPTGARNALFEIDVGRLRQMGVNVPGATQVRRDFGMPGGGKEVVFDTLIPADALRRVR
ncbi:MAG: RHS repeat-associated core domain-containing protein [Rhodocyclaceae bacterium]|nr:RHS repeat-associated core domain-containing protein [Rhodocyclaceae bacterium]